MLLLFCSERFVIALFVIKPLIAAHLSLQTFATKWNDSFLTTSATTYSSGYCDNILFLMERIEEESNILTSFGSPADTVSDKINSNHQFTTITSDLTTFLA